MKKSILYKSAAMMLALTSMVLSTSCGEDDGDNITAPEQKEALKTVTSTYDIEVSEDYSYFYDINVVHGIVKDSGTTVSLGDMGATFIHATYEYPTVEIPGYYFCKVVATPKDSIPNIDTTKVYKLERNCSFSIDGITAQGKAINLDGLTVHNSNSIKGNKILEYLEKGERVIADFSYTRNK